jgi:hypothetical protein
MIVDNYGFFLIGLPLKEIDENLVPGLKDNEYNYNYLSDYLNAYGRRLLPSLSLRDWMFGVPSGYQSSGLVGIYVTSGSYDFDEYDYESFTDDCVFIFNLFYGIFGKSPKIYMGNIQ